MTARRIASTSRRRYLKRAGAAAGVLGLAGCVGDFGDDGDSSPDGNESPTDDETGTDGGSGNESPNSSESRNETDANTTSEDDTDEKRTTGNESDGSEGNESTGTDPSEIPEAHTGYEMTEVRVVSADGEELGSVTAAIADTRDLRTLGLSDTESLPEDRGMLFVYDYVADRRFVMRRMDFGIDIVYADDEGVITSIHHAEAPEPDEYGEEEHHTYLGRGQYVLEVNYEWTAERGVEEGDVLEFDL